MPRNKEATWKIIEDALNAGTTDPAAIVALLKAQGIFASTMAVEAIVAEIQAKKAAP